MGPLMYPCDGHMVYEYSFIVDLDILSPLVQQVFRFRQLQERYGSLGLFAAVLSRENENKTQCKKKLSSPRALKGFLGCSQSFVPYYHGPRSIHVFI